MHWLRGEEAPRGGLDCGEFGFDLEGNLVNPMGYFVQGWELSAEGDRTGTIGDLNIGKSTPPVTTQTVELIANLDSRIAEETNEERLFESWNATNVANTPPSAAIDSTLSPKLTASSSSSCSESLTTSWRSPNRRFSQTSVKYVNFLDTSYTSPSLDSNS